MVQTRSMLGVPIKKPVYYTPDADIVFDDDNDSIGSDFDEDDSCSDVSSIVTGIFL